MQGIRILKSNPVSGDKIAKLLLITGRIALHGSEFRQVVTVGLADVKNVNAFETVYLSDIGTVIIFFNRFLFVNQWSDDNDAVCAFLDEPAKFFPSGKPAT